MTGTLCNGRARWSHGPGLSLATLLLLACAGPKAAAPPAATTAPAGATLSDAERAAAVQDLEASRQAFLTSLQGLSEAQFHFKPGPDRWSVAEVAEHIAVSEDLLRGMVTDKLVRTPTPPELLAQVQHDDARLRQLVTDRSVPRKAPEMLKPTGRFPTAEAVRAAFSQSRDRTVAYVQTTRDDLRGHAGPHPLLKALDGYQWLLLLSAHSSRHTAQIEEVKADPKFPRS
jgi:hypothetical protein